MRLLYLGRNSFRIVSNDTCIYIDPYKGDYSKYANIVLITHQHTDHNNVAAVNKDSDTIIISNYESIVNNEYKTFNINDILIEACEAYNKNHRKNECVGYIVTLENKVLYFTGDTSKTNQMRALANKNIDYAFYCCDGHYNMDITEAQECTILVNAKVDVPVHTSPHELFDMKIAHNFKSKNKLIINVNEEIEI